MKSDDSHAALGVRPAVRAADLVAAAISSPEKSWPGELSGSLELSPLCAVSRFSLTAMHVGELRHREVKKLHRGFGPSGQQSALEHTSLPQVTLLTARLQAVGTFYSLGVVPLSWSEEQMGAYRLPSHALPESGADSCLCL